MTTIALIDDHLIVRSGFAQLLNLEPDFQVVAEFGSGREALVEQALNAGARGFLSKRCSPDELIAAVRTVSTGGCYLTPDIAIKLAAGRQDPLTRRERQVAEKLAQGMSVKEIAVELGLSPKTVHVHRANLMEKLNVSNDVELARRMFDSWQ
ncbi:TPA: transcriptional regulator UhpA [Enterobacter hormaechei]|nr:transcriptional regulator UhpA [Enterobacter hormaechei]